MPNAVQVEINISRSKIFLRKPLHTAVELPYRVQKAHVSGVAWLQIKQQL